MTSRLMTGTRPFSRPTRREQARPGGLEISLEIFFFLTFFTFLPHLNKFSMSPQLKNRMEENFEKL